MGGKAKAQEKQARNDAQEARTQAEILSQDHRISDSVDLLSNDALERLREKLNTRH